MLRFRLTDSVIVGAYQRWRGQTSGDAESRTISEQRVHPEYSPSNFASDFMDMKLTEPIMQIEPVALNVSVLCFREVKVLDCYRKSTCSSMYLMNSIQPSTTGTSLRKSCSVLVSQAKKIPAKVIPVDPLYSRPTEGVCRSE